MATRRCDTCEFYWNKLTVGMVEEDRPHECHKNAPPLSRSWPDVNENDRCGEWRLKEAEGSEDGLATF